MYQVAVRLTPVWWSNLAYFLNHVHESKICDLERKKESEGSHF